MQHRLAHILLAFLLLCAQAFTAVHAIEHAAADEQGLPSHVCELCLAAHDLGAALAATTALPPLLAATLIIYALSLVGRSALPAPQARQQAPPSA